MPTNSFELVGIVEELPLPGRFAPDPINGLGQNAPGRN